MTSRPASWRANLMLAAISTLLALLALEFVIRGFFPQKLYRFPGGLFQSDPDVVFTLRPGFSGRFRSPEFSTTVAVNSHGLRGPEVSAKGPDVRRVLVLGDSFVSALNMEESDTFVSVSGRRLQTGAVGRPVEVINAGIPNYGTWHELRLLRRLAPDLNPDLAVLCVYVGNDIDNNLSPREAVVEDGFLVQRVRERGFLPYPVRSWLQRNSMSYALAFNAWQELRPWVGLPKSDSLAPLKALVSIQVPPRIEDGYSVSGRILQEMSVYLESRHIPLLVVLIPAELQVYAGRFEELIRREGMNPAEFDLDLPNRRWAALARDLSVPTLDLLPMLRNHTSGPPLFMTLDGHFTLVGNRLVGEALGDAILTMLAHAPEQAP